VFLSVSRLIANMQISGLFYLHGTHGWSQRIYYDKLLQKCHIVDAGGGKGTGVVVPNKNTMEGTLKLPAYN